MHCINVIITREPLEHVKGFFNNGAYIYPNEGVKPLVEYVEAWTDYFGGSGDQYGWHIDGLGNLVTEGSVNDVLESIGFVDIDKQYHDLFEFIGLDLFRDNEGLDKLINNPFAKLFTPRLIEARLLKVFLGGTCNGSMWREELISKLEVDYFNPVVENWTEACYEEELNQRRECDILLYVITPRMKNVYSIAEVVDDSNKRPDKTLFCILQQDGVLFFSDDQMKHLNHVGSMVEKNGAKCFSDLDSAANYINNKK